MRLKLRPSTVYGGTADGVFVQTPRDSFTLRLPPALVEAVCAWIRTLEEPHTVDDLVRQTGNPKAGPVIERVVQQLRARGAIVPVDYAVPGDVPEAAVAYVESHCEDPGTALDRLASAKVTVSGPEGSASAVRDALADRGVPAVLRTGGPQDAAALLAVRNDDGTLDVRLAVAGSRVWVASSGLAGAAHDALRDRLLRPGTPSEAALRLAAGLSADQIFRELTGLDSEAARTVHVVDSAPLGWRTVVVEPRHSAPADGRTLLLDDSSAADDLIGLYRRDTPGDWPQLPVCLARIAPGPGSPGWPHGIGWGRTYGEAENEALRAFLRSDDALGGAGATPSAALLDAALRVVAEELTKTSADRWLPGVPHRADIPATGAAPAHMESGPASWRHRLHEPAPGLYLAEVTDGTRQTAAWGLSPAQARDLSVGCAEARRLLDTSGVRDTSACQLDTRVSEELAAAQADVTEFAAALLGRRVAWRPTPPDVLVGAAPLAAGHLDPAASGAGK
ncbi:hypothetical protein AB0N14_09870 [Streptomyces sp. NPDC051104]|uniref:hypothetical protein n=1 Tax=Streptomyces sp. NPDC051104 TaxID=3155044 RepID=UPI00341E43D8